MAIVLIALVFGPSGWSLGIGVRNHKSTTETPGVRWEVEADSFFPRILICFYIHHPPSIGPWYLNLGCWYHLIVCFSHVLCHPLSPGVRQDSGSADRKKQLLHMCGPLWADRTCWLIPLTCTHKWIIVTINCIRSNLSTVQHWRGRMHEAPPLHEEPLAMVDQSRKSHFCSRV